MRSLRFLATASAALLALAPSAGHAESRWSSAAGAGLVFTTDGTGSGFWVDILRKVAPNWSAGVEAGYALLAGREQEWIYAWMPSSRPFDYPPGGDNRMASASFVLRGRSPGPVRFHFLGTFGGYDLSMKPDPFAYPAMVPPPPQRDVIHEQYPGFSLGLGVSAAGLIRPAVQLRWHQVIRPHNEYFDLVTFEAGLHFN
jgi:hypothetical protein